MFDISMATRRFVAAFCLMLLGLYFLDKYTVISIFDISKILHWKFLLIPVLISMVFMPTPDMIKDYKDELQKKKQKK